MSKKFESTERFMKPDVRYKSLLVTKFINNFMLQGKKSVAERILYKALDIIGERVQGTEPLEVFEAAIANVKPEVEVRAKRVGGATYQVPTPVTTKRQLSLAIRWIRDAVRKRKGKPMYENLAAELIAAYNHEGAAITVRENVHKMAEANKAFAHFAW
ncbi:MAG: 30S ribosomal protein S7 [Planctomycetota bacterium]